MKQKWIACCLAAALLCGNAAALPEESTTIVHAVAASGSLTEQLSWELDTSGVLTISGEGAMPDWSYQKISYLPSDIAWIGEAPPWDAYRADIKQVLIASGVTHVGSTAFACCPHLSYVFIPASVESIGENAFYGGLALQQVLFGSYGSLTEIAGGAFKYCLSLEKIQLPSSLVTIHGTAFDGTALTSLYLPGNVSTIVGDPFVGCSHLTEFLAFNDAFRSHNGALYTSDFSTLIRYPNREERFPQIHSQTTTIGDAALADLQHAQAVVLPDGVTTIGDYAMRNCPNLEVVYLPAGLSSIGVQAFDFTDLQTVYYGAGVTEWEAISIGQQSTTLLADAAFTNAANAWDTALSDGSKICGANAVWTLDNDGRLSIYGTGSLGEWNYGMLRFDGGTGITTVDWVTSPTPWYSRSGLVKSLVVYDGITEISDYAFLGCSQLESISLPASITRIGDGAFHYCPQLHAVDLSHITALDTLDRDAFADTSLEEVQLPASLRRLDMSAFDDTNLKKLHLPAGVSSLQVTDLLLTEITVDPANTTYAADGWGLYSKDRSELLYYVIDSGESIGFLADSVRSISRCSLQDVELDILYVPAGLQYFSTDAYWNDTSIQTIWFGGTQAQWEAVLASTGTQLPAETTVVCDVTLSTDLNLDGVVNASDASLTLLYGASAASGLTFSKMRFFYDRMHTVPLVSEARGDAAHPADLTGDGNLNAMDSSVMLCYAAAAAAGLPEGKTLETYLNR